MPQANIEPLLRQIAAQLEAQKTGQDQLAFFDAIAPIIHRESINFETAWFQSRYDKEGPGGDAARLPTSLGEALDALAADGALGAAFGHDFIAYFQRIKRSEARRYDEAADKEEFQRREYFSRL